MLPKHSELEDNSPGSGTACRHKGNRQKQGQPIHRADGQDGGWEGSDWANEKEKRFLDSREVHP